MTPTTAILLTAVAAVAAWAGVAVVRRAVTALSLLDVPNARSSHIQPMPTLGGIGIALGVAAGLAGVATIAVAGWSNDAAITLCVLSGGFGVVGLVDDTRGLGAVPQLLAQLVLAGLLCWQLGPMPHIDVPFLGLVPLGWAATPITILWLLAVTNLFNFFDGIDGLAGGQALLSCALATAAFFLAGGGSFAIICAIVAAATFGFLLHNFPPATIFMGNTGSTMLGFFLAGSATVGVARYDIPLMFFVLLLAPCLFDTTYTLARRIIRKERWWQAHRGHIYQRLTDAGLSQRQTDILEYGPMCVCGALGLAYLAAGDTARVVVVGAAMVLLITFAAWARRLVRRLTGGQRRQTAL